MAMAIEFVDHVEAAIQHITANGSGHTDVIVTEDEPTATKFLRYRSSSALGSPCTPISSFPLHLFPLKMMLVHTSSFTGASIQLVSSKTAPRVSRTVTDLVFFILLRVQVVP